MPAALIGYAHPFHRPRGATALAYLLALEWAKPLHLGPIIGLRIFLFEPGSFLQIKTLSRRKTSAQRLVEIICLEVAPAIDGGLPGMPQQDGFRSVLVGLLRFLIRNLTFSLGWIFLLPCCVQLQRNDHASF